MDFAWLTPPVVIASIALLIAFSNYYRSNYVIVRFINYSLYGGLDENKNRFWEIKFIVQNLGVPLHDLSMRLGFGTGGYLVMTSKDNESIREGTFHKGMITNFSFRSDNLTHMALSRLSALKEDEHIEKERPFLILCADDFEVWRYPIYSRYLSYKRKWNRLASKWKGWPKLPRFSDRAYGLTYYSMWLRTDAKDKADKQQVIVNETAKTEQKAATETENKGTTT